MKVTSFKIDKNLCADCSLALRRFIGGLDGVDSIDVVQGKIAISFDEQEMDEKKLSRIAKDSVEKLGYTLEEE